MKVSNPDTPPSPLPRRRPTAKRMLIRLAKERVAEIRRADLGETQPAEMILMIDQLARTVEDLVELCEYGC